MPIEARFDGQRAAQAYTEAFRTLARLTGFKQEVVLRSEAASILKRWAGATKVTTVEQADTRTRLRTIRGLGYTKAEARGDVTVNAGVRGPFGRVWIKVRNGYGKKNFLLALGAGFTKPVGRRGYSGVFNKYATKAGPTTQKWLANVMDAVDDVQSTLARRIPVGRRAIGLSRQSVVQIADKLGIDLIAVRGQGASASAIMKARAAMASNGRGYQNGVGYQQVGLYHAHIDLITRLPWGHKIGMDRSLARVLATRAKFIETAYAKGAFGSLRTAARAFPNLIKVTL